MRGTKPETELSAAIRDALKKMRVPVERIQAGQHRVKRGYLHCASEGTPDLCTPLGWLEVKMPGEEPSNEQEDWHAEWRRWGHRVAVVSSVDQAVSVVRRWQRDREFESKMGWVP